MGPDIILLFLVSAASAAAVTSTKLLVTFVPPFFLIAARLTFSALVFLLLGIRELPHFFKTARLADVFLIIRAGLIGLYASFLLEATALQLMASAKAAFFYTLAPFVAALFSFFFHRERLSVSKVLGLVLGFAGIIPLLVADAPTEGQTLFWSISVPEVVMGCSVLFYTYGWILLLQASRSLHQSSRLINAFAMGTAGIMAMATSWCYEPKFYDNFISILSHAPWWGYATFVGLVLLGTVFCYTVYVHLLRRHSATYVTLIEFTTPLYAAVYGALLLNEPITPPFVFSTAVVFSALLFFYKFEQMS